MSYDQELSSLEPNMSYINSYTDDYLDSYIENKINSIEFPHRNQQYSCDIDGKCKPRGNLFILILWFVIITVIVGVMLAILNPTVIQQGDDNGNPNGKVSACKVVIAAIVISLILVIVGYLIKNACQDEYMI